MAVQERVDMKSEPGLAVETIVQMAGQSGQKGFRFIHLRAAQLRRATSSSNSSSLRQAVVVDLCNRKGFGMDTKKSPQDI